MQPDEKADLIKETEWKAKVESRLESLEASKKVVMWALGAAALTVISQMWDQIKGVFFHGN
jgi:hypothetical protein